MVGRRWLAVVSAALVVVTGNLVVPQLAAPAFAAPAAVDDDPTVAGRGVAPAEEEPSPAEDATMVTAAVAEPPVWPEAASAVVKVPVPVGRAMPADTVPAEPVANVSVLADGAAPAAVRPGAGDADPTGPGPVDRAMPLELNGLTAGGLSRVRVTGEPRELAEALGAAQVFRLQRADGVFTASAADVRVDYSGYAEAFGGNYADRLRIFQVPECALAAGSWSGCGTGPIPVESVNHPGR